jgi:hypothetical protein
MQNSAIFGQDAKYLQEEHLSENKGRDIATELSSEDVSKKRRDEMRLLHVTG